MAEAASVVAMPPKSRLVEYSNSNTVMALRIRRVVRTDDSTQ